MLTSLKIENVAIIESAAIEFGCGLNVLTGETGAGKSIVIDSINAILGERTSREIIRTGAQSAKVYAVFEDVNENVKAFLDENGIDCEDGVLIINRTLNRDGKNICRLNGAPVTVSMLRELGGELITVGSDAHRAEHIAYDFDTAREILIAAGFNSYAVFRNRKAELLPL